MGKETIIKHHEVAEAARKFVDADYALCDKSKGYDCLSMILAFYRSLGASFPDEFKGFTEENYGSRWQNGEGLEEYYEFLNTIGEEVAVNYAIAGDLLIFEMGEKTPISAGIYLGNGHALMCFDKGIRVVPFYLFKKRLIEVRRWQL